jgi:DNA-binding transcriptional ArsR family regulator
MPGRSTPLKLASPIKTGAADCASKLRVLADPTRLAVLEALIDGPKHVGAIQKLLDVEQSLLSHHLQTLREAGLVESQRDGKAVLYRVSPNVVVRSGEAINLGCCVLSFKE